MSFLFIILGYLLGSIPFGYIFCKRSSGEDIRQSGSGATGATNVARRMGFKAALAVSVLDIAKGVAAVYIAKVFLQSDPWVAVAGGFAAVLGHCFPVWIGFRGGKGINTAFGAAIVLSWPAAAIALAVFALVFALSRIVSIASISAVCVFSIVVLTLGRFIDADSIELEAFAIALPALIIFTHRKNIARIIRGEELSPTRS